MLLRRSPRRRRLLPSLLLSGNPWLPRRERPTREHRIRERTWLRIGGSYSPRRSRSQFRFPKWVARALSLAIHYLRAYTSCCASARAVRSSFSLPTEPIPLRGPEVL